MTAAAIALFGVSLLLIGLSAVTLFRGRLLMAAVFGMLALMVLYGYAVWRVR